MRQYSSNTFSVKDPLASSLVILLCIIEIQTYACFRLFRLWGMDNLSLGVVRFFRESENIGRNFFRSGKYRAFADISFKLKM